MIIPKPKISVQALIATGNILIQRHRYSSKRDFSVKSPSLFGDFTKTYIWAERRVVMLQDGMVMFNIKDGKKTNEADHLKRYRSTVHGRRTARFVQLVKTKN